MAPFQILVVVGSLRRDSFNKKLAHALVKLGPADFEFSFARLDDLPLYNQDDDANQADSVKRLKAEIASSHGVLFATPEYNRSMPGVLKNAIDVGSRPSGKSAWMGKPAAIVSVSPGAIGGFGANQHIRQTLVFLDMPVLQQPEAYVGGAASHFDAEGNLAKEDTKVFLRKFLDAFADWIARLRR